MANEYTPGPWDCRQWDGPQWIVTSEGPQHFLATTVGGNDEANARLIAAAPELLEALQEYVNSDPEHGKFWENCQALIAKAVGV